MPLIYSKIANNNEKINNVVNIFFVFTLNKSKKMKKLIKVDQ